MSDARRCVVVATTSLLCVALVFVPATSRDGVSARVASGAVEPVSRDIAQTMWFQGFLADVDTGDPIDAAVTVAAEIFDEPTGGTSVWGSETHNGVAVVEGWFNIELGSIESLPGFDAPPYYLELTVDGEMMDTRQKLASVPMAHNAGDLELPYHGAANDQGTLFHLEQLGAGPGFYSRAGGGQPAITGVHSGSGIAVRGSCLSGTAGDFIGDVSVDGDLVVTGDVDVGMDGRVTVTDTLDALAVETYRFQMTRSPSEGMILTCDGAGNGYWDWTGAVTDDGDWTFSGIDMYSAASGNVGIGTIAPNALLDIYQSEGATAFECVAAQSSGRAARFEAAADLSAGNDLLELQVGSGTASEAQFIECELSDADIKFRVGADGEVTADGAFTGGGADLAEMVPVSGGASTVEPGDVMVIDPLGRGQTMLSLEARSTLVAGIYSTRPGFVASTRDWDNPEPRPNGEYRGYTMEEVAANFDEIPLAVVGIVPCKASAENGPIAVGDLLVTSGTPGHAMRDVSPGVGTVLGKALEPLAAGTGVIRVLVTLQ